MTLAERVLAGDPRAMARAISLIEDEDPAGAALLREIFRHTGRAYLVGVTGPPGAGKSTLVDRLVTAFRRPPRPGLDAPERGSRNPRESEDVSEASSAVPRVVDDAVSAPTAGGSPPREGLQVAPRVVEIGVIAVDPTSPFSGGAVLGDRLRMQSHADDEHVFIRSMATRGHLGGVARATADAALVLDAAGKDVIIIETVGVGQDEVDIIRTADVSVVTLVPGAGDDVQALKAGIMEIADIFVVNKSDREGADRVASAIESTLGLQTFGPDQWRPPILRTIATSGNGVQELVAAIWAFRSHAERMPANRRRMRDEHRLRELVSQRFMAHLEREVLKPGELGALVDRIAAREVDPYTAASTLVARAVPLSDSHMTNLPRS